MYTLTLLYRPNCPYCQKVLRFMEQNNMKLPMKNISGNSELRQELIGIGGKPQVPCLVIDGKPLYESNAIIAWLRENWSRE